MHFTTTSVLAAAVSILAITSESLVQAKYTCDNSLGTYYPYCINVPDGASKSDKFPTIVFLSGSGARGPASNVKSLSGYDGFGKLINQYLSGNRGAAQTMAAEKFITVIPISPQKDGKQEVRHWWPERLDDVYDSLRSKGYPIDWDQLHLSGYSMGGRGTWRNAVARPNLYASLSPSAGAAEKKGDSTLNQQKADPVFEKLDLIKDIPIMQFAGTSDTTASGNPPKSTDSQLKKLGARLSSLVMKNTDHSGMSTIPFDATLMNWMLKHRRRGASSQNDHDDEKEDGKGAGKKGGSKKDDGQKENDGRIKIDLKPVATGKSSPHHQLHTDIDNSEDDQDKDDKPSTSVKCSSGKKKSSKHSKKRSLDKRAVPRLTLAQIVKNAEDRKVKREEVKEEEKRSTTTPLERFESSCCV
ncbi:alpha/beta-hydrolase [Cystobasidium minutum MCA 4210]|uniref:alpha/beta-hydrolase n=1 Tax=Cystobasidium minutum MCA 4210 TaxID=1397322 RepID=UPI0034CF8E95|eukprot:jgi/Rhomi1/208203/estExt_Genemark1.C_1_t30232